MNSARQVPHLFFIDLDTQKVFCRACGTICRSLVLADSREFWCATRNCINHNDIRLFEDGTWQVFGFEEKWHETLISEIVPVLLQRIVSGKKAEQSR
jgi:hypothetical protein